MRLARYLESPNRPSLSPRPSRSLLIVISIGMSFGTELNGFVNGVVGGVLIILVFLNRFDPLKSQDSSVSGGVDKVEAVCSHFQVILLPFLVPLKKVKMHNLIACKSQLCALHVTKTPATQTYVQHQYVYCISDGSGHRPSHSHEFEQHYRK